MPPTILLIEDILEIRENIVEILQLKNFQVQTAADDSAAIQMAKANKPDVILCDMGMFYEDGYERIQHLKTQPETQDVPLIVITSQFEKNNITPLYKLGISDYIIKPFDGKALIDRITFFHD